MYSASHPRFPGILAAGVAREPRTQATPTHGLRAGAMDKIQRHDSSMEKAAVSSGARGGRLSNSEHAEGGRTQVVHYEPATATASADWQSGSSACTT